MSVNLIDLDLDDNPISDVSALKDLINLTELDLDDNLISDVSPLKDLINLTWLDVDDNEISDLSPFENMTKLTYLDLNGNKISDLSSLKNMTELMELDLDGNKISDISALKDLINLKILDLHDNEILDISPLKNMVNLMDLDLDDNKISDISALKNMVNLTVLDLDGNNISDISPLSALLNLAELDLHDNRISNIFPLKDLTNLMVLDISENRISDFSPLAGLIENLVEYDNSNQTDLPIKTSDVNRDGIVNIIDLALVAAYYEDADFTDAASFGVYPDVNGDSVIDIRDLVVIAGEIDAAAAAPTLRKNRTETSGLTAEALTEWVQLAKQLDTEDLNTRRGVIVLEALLAALTDTESLPKETVLLANYPNPFNPETWIPYELSKSVEVSISIHSLDGKVVRLLELGVLPAGVYRSKSRAAYWNGRNGFGESVASGVYFYTLNAGDFTATGKMIIRK